MASKTWTEPSLFVSFQPAVAGNPFPPSSSSGSGSSPSDGVCVFVDHGLMRKNEGDEVEAAFSKWDINFVRVDAEQRFLIKLAGVSEPEHKRKIIGEEFIRVFEEEAKKIGRVDYLVQGTIYPDVIESGAGDAAVIKSHHNVGGLPDYVDFKEIIEPLRLLFKDEVRQLGRELKLPEYLVMRQPFPGPGLAIRVIGDLTKDKLDRLRDADAIYREEIAAAGLGASINQYFAVLTNTRSVGVMDFLYLTLFQKIVVHSHLALFPAA